MGEDPESFYDTRYDNITPKLKIKN
jgi:hypothetical protein